MSALTTLEMDLDCTHKESIKKAYIHSSVTRCSMMIYKKRIYKTTIQTAGVYPKQQGTKIYLLFVWSKEKRSEESAFFPRKYLKKSKINKISDFPTKKESNQWRKHRENHHLHPQRDRLSLSLSLSLSRAEDPHPTNYDQHAKGKIEQRNIRVHLNSDILWLFLLARRRRRRRREETILHHYGSFFFGFFFGW
jgi:hypothetical protein